MMAYFPDTVLPKQLKQETSHEVDNSPLVFNAKDYNRHEREIIAVERFLLGDDPTGANSLLNNTKNVLKAFDNLTSNGFIQRICKTVVSGNKIVLPFGASQTTGAVLATDTTIPISSTNGLPPKGFVTKFNNITISTVGSPQYVDYGFGKTITCQEFIRYTGITPAVGLTPAQLTGCTRGMMGTTAQDVASNKNAVIFAGRASLALMLKSYNLSPLAANPNQFFLSQGSDLTVSAGFYDSASSLKSIDLSIEVLYSLFLIASFSDIVISG